MGFDVPASAYDQVMGRYSAQLAPRLADLAGVRGGQRVLDVGCGPGALTGELAARVGDDAVNAVDPSPSFVAAVRERLPGIDVSRAGAEELPFANATFDAALAQLVVHFMDDPVAGLREMCRVTKPGGAVAACVWDHAGDRSPITGFWQGVALADPEARNESALAGAREGHLAELFGQAGLRVEEEATLTAEVEYDSFEAWWEPFTLGVGPAGAYAQNLDAAARDDLRERCRGLLPSPPFTVTAHAWAVRGTH
jgi:SAM-dependent methyltransferase